MIDNCKIEKYCLRYVVPFKFVGKFKDKCEALSKITIERRSGEKRKLWKENHITAEECDLYEYIYQEFSSSDDEYKLGARWRVEKNDIAFGNERLKELLFFENGILRCSKEGKPEIAFSIVNEELFLFRNGLGFFVYDIEINDRFLTLGKLKLFQNCIKELNRTETQFWVKLKQKPNKESDKFPELLDNDKHKNVYYSSKENNGSYKITAYMSFSFGEWVKEQLACLNVIFFSPKKSAYYSLEKRCEKEILDEWQYRWEKEIRDKSKSNKSLAELAQYYKLSNEKLNENRIGEDEKEGSNENIVPDKALLFTYCVTNSSLPRTTQEEKADLVWHFAKGYKNTYHYNNDDKSLMLRPFDCSMIFASQEGVAYLAWPSDDNKEQYVSDVFKSIRMEYFLLYIKVLYQSYSLLMYAEKTQKSIMADYQSDSNLNNTVGPLLKEINHFLVKSMATSVSYVHEQSDYYVYLKKQLKIHEDVKSVTAGLNSLELLLRKEQQRDESNELDKQKKYAKQRDQYEKEKDKKIQAGVGLMALLGVSSALADGYDFIRNFNIMSDEGFHKLPEVIQDYEIKIVFFTLVIGAIVTWYAIKACKDSFSLNIIKLIIILLIVYWMYIVFEQIVKVRFV